MKYLFVVGRDRDLGVLEIVSFLRAKNINFEVVYSEKRFIVLEMNNFNSSVEEFGGIVKIGKRVNIEDIYFDKSKITYSVYGRDILEKLKKRFKEEGVKAVFRKYSDDPNNLDLEIIKIKEDTFQIVSVSNPKGYKKRDETRPKFDGKKVVSIRLAKILVNLSQARTELLDPFCGCGTILQEALLKNLDVVGIDKDISDARSNLKWLKENFSIKNSFNLIQGDARRLSSYLAKVEAIATEPYMGAFLKKIPQSEEAKKIAKELNVLYSDFFREARKIVKGKLVFVEPIIKIHMGEVNVGFEGILIKNGFKATIFTNAVNPIEYDLKGSKIKRRIWVLERFK